MIGGLTTECVDTVFKMVSTSTHSAVVVGGGQEQVASSADSSPPGHDSAHSPSQFVVEALEFLGDQACRLNAAEKPMSNHPTAALPAHQPRGDPHPTSTKPKAIYQHPGAKYAARVHFPLHLPRLPDRNPPPPGRFHLWKDCALKFLRRGKEVFLETVYGKTDPVQKPIAEEEKIIKDEDWRKNWGAGGMHILEQMGMPIADAEEPAYVPPYQALRSAISEGPQMQSAKVIGGSTWWTSNGESEAVGTDEPEGEEWASFKGANGVGEFFGQEW